MINGRGRLSATLSVLIGLRNYCRYGCFHIDRHIATARNGVGQYDLTAGKSLCQVCTCGNGNCYNSCVATGTSGSFCCRNFQPGRCFTTDGDTLLRHNGQCKTAVRCRFGHDHLGIVRLAGCGKVVCAVYIRKACQRRDSRVGQFHCYLRCRTVFSREGQCRSTT